MINEDVIKEVCSIMGLVYHSIGDYSFPNDGFCSKCAKMEGFYFQNSGEIIEYVRMAVMKALKDDGCTIHKNFDPITGKDLYLYDDVEELGKE